MKFLLQIVFLLFTWFTNQVYSNEQFFKFTQSIHGVNKGYSIRVAKIWDDFDNGIYLSDLNIYNAANDGTVLLDDIIELSSIKLRRPNGTFADVEYRVVITSQGKVRMISKFNLDKIVNSSGDLLSSFKITTGINAINSSDNTLLNTVKGWQGSGSYPGVDDWEIFEIPAGTKLYGGLPGQSEFYSVEKSLLDVNFDKASYWNSLQVSPHPQFGYRPKVGEYTVNTTIKVAVSKTLANPQHGAGGAWQVFVDDFVNKVTFTKEITLK
jgi:hypothetical protein